MFLRKTWSPRSEYLHCCFLKSITLSLLIFDTIAKCDSLSEKLSYQKASLSSKGTCMIATYIQHDS